MLKNVFLSLIFINALVSTSYSSEKRGQGQEFQYVPGEFLVKLDSSAFSSRKELRALSQLLNSSVRSTIPAFNLVVVRRPSFELRSTAINQLKSIPGVLYAEPNYIYTRQQTADEYFTQQWGLQNLGQKDSSGTQGFAGIDVSAVEAWKIQTGRKDVVVAVIDTGVDYNQQDLKDNMWINSAELKGAPNVDDDGNGYVDDVYGYSFVNGASSPDPMDDHGHGSHCAGVIGAKTNNNIGMAGINWDVQIMAVKFLSKGGSGTLEDAVKAIDYAVKNGAHILSNSWGGGPFSQALFEAIKKSHEAGALFIAAAGNSSLNNDKSEAYPANYDLPNVISVAAIDNRGKLASFSSYGKKKVHLGAPGVNILSITTKGYESWSGTSMATPHVSGVAALVKAQDGQLSNTAIKNRLISTAALVPGLRQKVSSGGMVSAYASLMNIPTPADPNDPTLWTHQPVLWSTPHPYEKDSELTFELTVPGAKEIALYFEKFETEARYDWLEIYNAEGELISKMTGALDQSYSDAIKGDYAKLIFKSDNIIQGWGIDLTKVAYR
jgi:thermitase